MKDIWRFLNASRKMENRCFCRVSAFSKTKPANHYGSTKKAGGSGRRKLCLADWDCDGKLDLLLNSRNVLFYRNISGTGDSYAFEKIGPVDDRVLAGHSTSPTIVDWDHNGVPDLLVGAEDGFLYYMKNPHAPDTGTRPPKF
jgi:hypothetical protein